MIPSCLCRLLLLSLLELGYHAHAEVFQSVLNDGTVIKNGPLTISNGWDVLGPFRIGTRGTPLPG